MIDDLIARVFAARNAAHLAHWKTKSYAQHMALGSFYDDVIGSIDGIVECYQGANQLVQVPVSKLVMTRVANSADNMAEFLRGEAAWIQSKRDEIAGDNTALQNLIDDLISHYHKAVYKLTFLS